MVITLRFFITAILLLLLATQLDLSLVVSLLQTIKLHWVFAALSLMVLLRVIAAIRWHCVLKHHAHSVSLLEVIEITFISSSLGHFLPSGVGGDVVRGMQLSHRYGLLTETASSILVDRAVGIFSMLLMGLMGLIGSAIARSNVDTIDFFWPLLLVNITFISLWFASARVHSILQASAVAPPQKAQRVYQSALQILETVANRKRLYRLLPRIFSLSILAQLLRCLMFYFLYRAFGIDLPFIYFVAYVPLVFVVMQLPLSIGGLGLREGALVYFFGALGIASEVSVNVGIISHGLQILAVLPGLLLWMLRRSYKSG
ncbi:MAG: YbhN family protein [Pseudomonadales bacterium]